MTSPLGEFIRQGLKGITAKGSLLALIFHLLFFRFYVWAILSKQCPEILFALCFSRPNIQDFPL
ncbi:MAG: hypothetical protein CVU60_17445 [Deltaproteobacteria bacterium HGW-Deltaproteobacteria-18]|jgi:hypothetical protein|nr:MAG: hypothetical protein CVU60_17445 [Deltaproteobacteria bacterium HGW-Deltaproteobacteria-18]